MTRTDFSEPRRMSAGAFFILFIKMLKSVTAPVMIFIAFDIIGSGMDIVDIRLWIRLGTAIGACVTISLLLAAAAYFPRKFYIKDGNIIYTRGIIQRENACIPLDRVHSLRTRQGLWYRLFKMRGIMLDTLATRAEEIELILDEADWQSLLSRIEKEEHPKQTDACTPPEYNPVSSIRFDNGKLILDALCQNHLKGMAVLGGLVAVVLEHIDDYFKTDTITDYATSYYDKLTLTPTGVGVILFAVYIMVLLLWLGKILLRYYDMEMSYDKHLLSFTYGLLSRMSSRFAYDKICTIWVKRNFFEKKSGLCTLMLKQALNVTAENEEDNLKLYGADTSSFFLKWWLGDEYLTESEIISAKSGKGVFYRSFVPGLTVSAGAIGILLYMQLIIWILIPALYLLFVLLRSIYAMRKSRITLKESYFIVHNGRFADIENYVKYSTVEVVGIRRTPFSRWFHRATLVISTPGSSFSVISLKETEALQIYEILLNKCTDKS